MIGVGFSVSYPESVFFFFFFWFFFYKRKMEIPTSENSWHGQYGIEEMTSSRYFYDYFQKPNTS